MIKNIIFMGTPDFAVPTLLKLINSAYKPVLVISQPDKPKGRNLKLIPTPVKEIALQHNIECFQPDDVNSQDSLNYIKSFKPDLIVTVAYGAFLNKDLRILCPFGAINLHPSLLPLHRGSDPVRNTLLCGDKFCGLTVFFITAKMDSGQIIIQKKYEISSVLTQINFTNLETFLAQSGAEEVINSINILENSELRFSALKHSFIEQDHSLASFSKKVEKDSNLADFSLSAGVFLNHLQAYAYEPGYFCYFRNKRLKLFSAEICNSIENSDYPVIKAIIKNKGFILALKDADLLITEVQFEGKKAMNAWQFHIGARLEFGERFCSELSD